MELVNQKIPLLYLIIAYKLKASPITRPATTITVIIAKTTKGKDVSFMENSVNWHGAAPNDEQHAQAIAELKTRFI